MITTMVGNYPKISPDAKAPSLRAAISRYDESRITLEELKRVEEEVTGGELPQNLPGPSPARRSYRTRWPPA